MNVPLVRIDTLIFFFLLHKSKLEACNIMGVLNISLLGLFLETKPSSSTQCITEQSIWGMQEDAVKGGFLLRAYLGVTLGQ